MMSYRLATKIITPIVDTLKYTMKDYPQIEGREMRFVQKDKLDVSSQFMSYGSKLVITNYKEDIISLVISQPDIAISFNAVFDLLWMGAGEL